MENKTTKIDALTDETLRSIEFPGDDAGAITDYLRERRFAENVMQRVRSGQSAENKIAFWGLFTLADILLLTMFGMNGKLIAYSVSSHPLIVSFFYMFLGLTLLGGLCGFFLTIDRSWLSPKRYRVFGERIAGLPKRMLQRLFR